MEKDFVDTLLVRKRTILAELAEIDALLKLNGYPVTKPVVKDLVLDFMSKQNEPVLFSQIRDGLIQENSELPYSTIRLAINKLVSGGVLKKIKKNKKLPLIAIKKD